MHDDDAPDVHAMDRALGAHVDARFNTDETTRAFGAFVDAHFRRLGVHARNRVANTIDSAGYVVIPRADFVAVVKMLPKLDALKLIRATFAYSLHEAKYAYWLLTGQS